MRHHRAPSVFGRNLQQTFQANKGRAPSVFTESLGLLHESVSNPDLFKSQSDRRKVQLLQKAWDQGRNPLRLAGVHDARAVSDCLLDWLNSLPSPLIPCRLFHAFLHVHQTCSHTQWLHQLQALFDKLEPWEAEVIVPLLSFLHEYEDFHRGKNFRNPSLGQMFGPALLKPHDQALPLPFPEEVQGAAALVDCMITDYDLIFRPMQSPCSSPMKKPPTRAKISPPKKECTPFVQTHSVAEDKRKQFAARMVPSDKLQVKHLRVNVVPPARFQDENCGPSNWGGETQSSLSQLLHGNTANALMPISTTLAPCNPLDSEGEALHQNEGQGGLHQNDEELDMVVGNLLCGSLSGMLFEPDDQKFLNRTTSSMSTASPSISCHQSEMSADLSSDEELAQFCPQVSR